MYESDPEKKNDQQQKRLELLHKTTCIQLKSFAVSTRQLYHVDKYKGGEKDNLLREEQDTYSHYGIESNLPEMTVELQNSISNMCLFLDPTMSTCTIQSLSFCPNTEKGDTRRLIPPAKNKDSVHMHHSPFLALRVSSRPSSEQHDQEKESEQRNRVLQYAACIVASRFKHTTTFYTRPDLHPTDLPKQEKIGRNTSRNKFLFSPSSVSWAVLSLSKKALQYMTSQVHSVLVSYDLVDDLDPPLKDLHSESHVHDRNSSRTLMIEEDLGNDHLYDDYYPSDTNDIHHTTTRQEDHFNVNVDDAIRTRLPRLGKNAHSLMTHPNKQEKEEDKRLIQPYLHLDEMIWNVPLILHGCHILLRFAQEIVMHPSQSSKKEDSTTNTTEDEVENTHDYDYSDVVLHFHGQGTPTFIVSETSSTSRNNPTLHSGIILHRTGHDQLSFFNFCKDAAIAPCSDTHPLPNTLLQEQEQQVRSILRNIHVGTSVDLFMETFIALGIAVYSLDGELFILFPFFNSSIACCCCCSLMSHESKSPIQIAQQIQISDNNIAIFKLTRAKKLLEQRIHALSTAENMTRSQAIDAKRRMNTNIAILHMKRRKMILDELDRLYGSVVNLETGLHTLRRAQDDVTLLKSYELLHHTMKLIQMNEDDGGFGLQKDRIDDVLESIRIENKELSEVHDELVSTTDFDSTYDAAEELENEFRALEIECQTKRINPITDTIVDRLVIPTVTDALEANGISIQASPVVDARVVLLS